MSIEAISWAAKKRVPNSGAKFVLIALCNYADDQWSCFPGQKTLAEWTSMGERTVRRHLDWLEEKGYVVSEPRFSNGRRTSNRYFIRDPDTEATPAPAAPVRAARASGSAVRTGRKKGNRSPEQAANLAAGQSDRRPDPAGQAANLAGQEPSENHQEIDPLPPSVQKAQPGAEPGCSAHPTAKAANCRGCGTNTRARRDSAPPPPRPDVAKARTALLLQEGAVRRKLVDDLEAAGKVEPARRAAREGIIRHPPEGMPPEADI